MENVCKRPKITSECIICKTPFSHGDRRHALPDHQPHSWEKYGKELRLKTLNYRSENIEPWLCDSCAGANCSICGAGVQHYPGTYVLCDGSTINVSHLYSAPAGCQNVHCKRHVKTYKSFNRDNETTSTSIRKRSSS